MVTRSTGGYLHYLLLTDGGVFKLTLVREKEDYPFCKSRWVLRYRVKDDVPAKKESHGFSNVIPLYPVNRSNNSSPLPQGTSKLMAVPVPLLNIVYYHGHLCPELAVGYRVGLVAQNGRASAADLDEYQQAIDDAVREILSIPDESLFAKTRVSLRPPQTACRRDYIRCSCCGEVVAVQKAVVGEDELLCQICAARKMV